MTQKEKADAYDEALIRAKDALSSGVINRNVAALIQHIFPELKESESEKIRKGIIECVKGNMPDNDSRKKYIAWLEKQGKEYVKQKFHGGESIVHQGTGNIYTVVAVIDDKYQLKYGDNYTIQKCADVDRCARLLDTAEDVVKNPFKW